MTDQVTASGIQEVTDQRIPVIAGRVTQYCSNHRVAVEEVIEGENIVIGDDTQFGPVERPGNRRRPVWKVHVTSIQKDHRPVERADGPGSFGIKTGFPWIPVDTPVYVLKSADPVEG